MTPAEEMLQRHEGYRKHVYRDTEGHLTIGIGLNLDAGLPIDEAQLLMQYRCKQLRTRLGYALPCFNALSLARQDVLVNMAYNLGIGGLLKFRNLLAAIEEKKWEKAKAEMLDSKWAQQVGSRADELAGIMFHGRIEVG